jgi:hypothetical protein
MKVLSLFVVAVLSKSCSASLYGQAYRPDQKNVSNTRVNGSAISCPQNTIYYCDNPLNILNDTSIVCNPVTCEWNLTALDPAMKPSACGAVEINTTQKVADRFEPCLWWEIMYGDMQGKPTLLNNSTRK